MEIISLVGGSIQQSNGKFVIISICKASKLNSKCFPFKNIANSIFDAFWKIAKKIHRPTVVQLPKMVNGSVLFTVILELANSYFSSVGRLFYLLVVTLAGMCSLSQSPLS